MPRVQFYSFHFKLARIQRFRSTEPSKFCKHRAVATYTVPLASIMCHGHLKYWHSFVLPCIPLWFREWSLVSVLAFFLFIGPGHEAGRIREDLKKGTGGLLQNAWWCDDAYHSLACWVDFQQYVYRDQKCLWNFGRSDTCWLGPCLDLLALWHTGSPCESCTHSVYLT